MLLEESVNPMTGKQIVLVTGASSGIGAAIAARLAIDGHQVIGTSRKVSRTSGGGVAANGVEMMALDVCSDESVRTCVNAVLQKAGRIDVLVNNAGYLLACAIEDATIDEAKAQFETNFFGIVRMVKAVLPGMRAQRNGLILNMSSLAGRVPAPFWGYYNASKFAVEGYTETLRAELKPLGVRVSMLEPGAIKTPFYAAADGHPMPEYSPWRERAYATMKDFEKRAPGPEVVASTVSKIVTSSNPRLRYPLTMEGRALPFIRPMSPGTMFEAATRIVFHLDQ